MIAERMGEIEQRLVKSDTQLRNLGNESHEERTAAKDEENKNRTHFI
jgi:hypothetical protein